MEPHAGRGPSKAVRVRIEGRVQGVGFRTWVERAATGRGLNGCVRNRRDGGVEAVFAGPADVVDAMVDACHHGPQFAHVLLVKVMLETRPVADGFHIAPTA